MFWEMHNSVIDAVQHFSARFLSNFNNDLDKLIFIAATIDFPNGRYYHPALSLNFQPKVAECALAVCHNEVFENITLTPLGELVQQFQEFLEDQQDSDRVLAAWDKLQSHRVLLPVDCDCLAGELFCSNMQIALRVLAIGGAFLDRGFRNSEKRKVEG